MTLEELLLAAPDVDVLSVLAIFAGLAVKYSLGLPSWRVFFAGCAAGIGCALFLSEPVIDFLKLEGDYYRRALYFTFSFGGEHVVSRTQDFFKAGKISDVKDGF